MDSDVRVRAFTRRSAVVREGITSPPLTGTVPGTGGIGRAYGLMLRWWRMVANQPTRCTTKSGSHAVRAAEAASAAPSSAALRTPHLLRPGVAEQRFHVALPLGGARHEDAELVVREAGVPGDRAQAARRKQRIEPDAEDRRERAEQHRHLEHDDDVGRDRPDRLAADNDGPVVRLVERDPGADRAPRDAPISVNMRTGLTAWASASSISWRGIGEYTVKSVFPSPRSR